MVETRILRRGDSKIWDDFVDRNAHGTFFHKDAWLTLCERTQNAKLLRLGFFHNGELIGIFPVFIKRFFVFKVVASPIVVEDTPYLGPLYVDEKFVSETLNAFDAFLKKRRVNFVRFIIDRKQYRDLAEKLKYTHVLKTTHVLDLTQDKESLWKNMEGRARTAIRKAEKSGVKVSFVDGIEYLDKYYELLKTFFAVQKYKTPANSEMFFRSVLGEELRNHVKMVIGELDGTVIGGAIILHYKNTIYYLDAVNDRNYMHYNVSSLIQWFIICWGADEGFRNYDFVGSDFPAIARFKCGFGGKRVEYSLFEKGIPEWVRSVKQVYGYQLKPTLQRIKSWRHRRI